MGHMRFEPNINVHITDSAGVVHKTAITEIKIGYDGIVIWREEPRVQPDGSVLPQDVSEIVEVCDASTTQDMDLLVVEGKDHLRLLGDPLVLGVSTA